MSRLIYVTDNGDDLDGDGSAAHPFQSEDRAELDAEVGDVILVFDNDGVFNIPDAPLPAPPEPAAWLKPYLTGAGFLVAGMVISSTFQHNPALAVLVGGVVAIAAVTFFDR